MKRNNRMGYILQDTGLVLFLFCIGIAAIVVANAGKDQLMEFTIMMILTFFAVLMAGFKWNGFAIVIAGCSILGYTSYKLYYFFYQSQNIQTMCYAWVILPIAAVAAMMLFVYGNSRTELENDLLKDQVEKLVMVNSIIGLYNLKSLYNDLNREKAYAVRNNISFSLMLIKPRYEQELKKILTKSQFEELLQKMSEIIVDIVRIEDRTYSLDDSGTVGVILTCAQDQSDYVMRRLRAGLEKQDAYVNIVDTAIRVEVRMACLEYKEELYHNNMMQFKQGVENELQYDV